MYVKDSMILLKVWNSWRHTAECQVSTRQIEERKAAHFQKHTQHSKKQAYILHLVVDSIS